MEQRLPAGAAFSKGSRIKRQSAFASAAIIDESWIFTGVATEVPLGPGASVARM
jgi:hypothetical protein